MNWLSKNRENQVHDCDEALAWWRRRYPTYHDATASEASEALRDMLVDTQTLGLRSAQKAISTLVERSHRLGFEWDASADYLCARDALLDAIRAAQVGTKARHFVAPRKIIARGRPGHHVRPPEAFKAPDKIIEPDIPAETWTAASVAFEAAGSLRGRLEAAAPIIIALATVGNGPTASARYLSQSGRLSRHWVWGRRRAQQTLAVAVPTLPPRWGGSRA